MRIQHITFIGLLFAFCCLSACGQTGSLYLPEAKTESEVTQQP